MASSRKVPDSLLEAISRLSTEGNDQAARVIAAFESWLDASPCRRIIMSRGGDGFKITLDEQSCLRGTSLLDACGQAGMVALAEVSEP
jgi:hypothetical protein